MMTSLLTAATNFIDIWLQDAPGPGHVPCPVCAGHGKWNLAMNAYGIGRHFQQQCGQCNGHGWVPATSPEATCVHTWQPTRPSLPWYCWTTDVCTQCGQTRSYSTDD